MENGKNIVHNNGQKYELFVQKIQQAILDAEPQAQQKNIKVEHNCKLIDRCGCERQFDLYWEYELGGYTYKNIIECKDYENGVSIDKLDALIGKMHDLPGIRAIIATRVKFQTGAIEKAKANNIDIIVVRNEDVKNDWVSFDGLQLMRELHINLHFIMPIEIKDFRPIVDKKWAQEHGFTTVTINAPDNEIFLEYADSGKMLSLHEYFEKIPRNKSESTITNTFKENFENVFLLANGQKIKITAIEIDYIATTPHVRTIKIAPEVKGVVEYLNRKQRILVLQDGEKEFIRTIR